MGAPSGSTRLDIIASEERNRMRWVFVEHRAEGEIQDGGETCERCGGSRVECRCDDGLQLEDGEVEERS